MYLYSIMKFMPLHWGMTAMKMSKQCLVLAMLLYLPTLAESIQDDPVVADADEGLTIKSHFSIGLSFYRFRIIKSMLGKLPRRKAKALPRPLETYR